MNPSEFKAWMDGFSQGIGDAPTAEQWAIVRAKVNELSNPLGNLTFPPNVRGVGGSAPVYSPNQCGSSGSFKAVKA